jgi:hypothetical protein
MADKIFTDGMIVKKPHANAPDFIIANLSFKVDEFRKFLIDNAKGGWVNADIKIGQSGKYYAELNTWEKPSGVDEVKQGIREKLSPEMQRVEDARQEHNQKVEELSKEDEDFLNSIPF